MMLTSYALSNHMGASADAHYCCTKTVIHDPSSFPLSTCTFQRTENAPQESMLNENYPSNMHFVLDTLHPIHLLGQGLSACVAVKGYV